MRFSVLGFRSDKRIELQAPVPISVNDRVMRNFARILISRNFAYAKFRENKILAKISEFTVPLSRGLVQLLCANRNISRLLFSSAEMFKKPLWQTMWTQIRLLIGAVCS